MSRSKRNSKPVTGRQADRCKREECNHMRRYHRANVAGSDIYHTCSKCGDPTNYFHKFEEEQP
jgi:hypothetical protein